MAAYAAGTEIKLSVNSNNNNNNNTVDKEEKRVNLIQRAQWLRAAILGANDGLLSTTSLMLGVGAAKEDERLMIISGLAGAIAGAFSMAVGEFVSVSTQREIEHATTTTTTDIHKCNNDNDKSIKPQEISMSVDHEPSRDTQTNNPLLPNPYKAAGASGLAFLCGSLVPLLSGMLIPGYKTRAVGIVLVTSVALVIFGGAGARLGGSSVRISALRVLFGGWISMAFTYGLLKAFDTDRKGHDSD